MHYQEEKVIFKLNMTSMCRDMLWSLGFTDNRLHTSEQFWFVNQG